MSFTDEELLSAAGLGDAKAQYKLHQRYYGKLLGVCMRYARSRQDAEEIVNEAFCKIFMNTAQYRGEGKVGAWMRRITVYTAIDQVRKDTRYKKVFFPAFIPDTPIQNEALSNLGVEELVQLIQQLPASSRLVFSLFVVEGYSHAEIGAVLGISAGASKWHLNKARKQLQEALKKNSQCS